MALQLVIAPNQRLQEVEGAGALRQAAKKGAEWKTNTYFLHSTAFGICYVVSKLNKTVCM